MDRWVTISFKSISLAFGAADLWLLFFSRALGGAVLRTTDRSAE